MGTELKYNKEAVYGIYPFRRAVERAVEEFKTEGFRNSDISVLLSSESGTDDFANENATKAPEAATAGGISGATIGGVMGWLAGIGTLAIPGVGPLIAAGPLMAALAGAGVGGVIGGVAGALIGLGIPEYEAALYEDRISNGGVLLAVHVDNAEWEDKAREIMKRTGAEEISKRSDVLPSDSSIEEPTAWR